MSDLVISATVYPDSQEAALKAMEILARAAAGLALEGISVSINATNIDEEDEPA